MRPTDRPTADRTYAPPCKPMWNETLKTCAATRVFFGGWWDGQLLSEKSTRILKKTNCCVGTNNEIWNPRATEKAKKQAKCQLKTKMWWVSNSQVTLQTIIGNFPYLTYFKLDTNTWVVAIYDKYSWINYFWTFTELFTIMNCFEHFVLDLMCIINSFAAHICKHAVNA